MYDDWPAGRGVFHTQDNGLFVWVNEEEHVRVFSCTDEHRQGESAKDVGNLALVYERLLQSAPPFLLILQGILLPPF